MSQVNKDTSVRVKESTKFRLDKSKGSKSHDAFIAEMLDYFDATGIMPQSKIASPAVTVKEQASRVIEVVRGVEKATNTRLKNIEQMLLRLVPGQMPVNENTSSSINPDEFMHLSQVQELLEKAKEQDRLIANYRDEIDKLRTELDNASGHSDNHPAKDVQSGNTGSCHDLVHYLQKEGDTGLAFFSHTDNDVSPEKVITNIDGNRSKLGSDEAKFYMLSLNPSQAEQVHLIGREVNSLEELTPEERQAVYRKLEKFTRSAMDEYARNFQREAVKDGGDLMYYARIETKRTFSYSDEEVKKGLAKIGDVKPGLNLHVHVIVSRKSKNGKVKLSPAAKSAGNSWELEGRGTVKRGFSHENWKVSVQQCFDREFQYQVVQSDCFVHPAVPDTISNPELRSLLQQQQFTAANQIVAAMKELGFTHQVRRGVHTFSRQGESFQVSHKELKTFECPLSDARIRDIADRFDLTRYEADPLHYHENGLQVKNIGFGTYVNEGQQQNRTVKQVSYQVIYDEQNKVTVSLATVRQFAYDNKINLVKTEPEAESILKKLKNNDLRNLLSDYRFTSANQIVVAMKEQGYEHRVRKGVHTFSNDRQKVSIRHKDLMKFANPKLEPERMTDIISRFNLYKYRLDGVFYHENGLKAKNISFKTYKKVPIEEVGDAKVIAILNDDNNLKPDRASASSAPEEAQKPRFAKVLKEVSYDVLFDEQTKTYLPVSSIRKFAFDNDIALIDRFRHAYAVPNPDMRALLENPEYTTLKQINRAMRDRGYTVETDESGNYSYTKDGCTFSIDRRDLLAFTGYARDNNRQTSRHDRQQSTSAEKAAGMLGGSVGHKVINEILGDNFRTERMVAGNAKKVVSVIKNPANLKMILLKQIGSYLNPFKEL